MFTIKQSIYTIFIFSCLSISCVENFQKQNNFTKQESSQLQGIKDTNTVPPNYTFEDTIKNVAVSLDTPIDNRKYIYFTIDDGPSNYSDDILAMAQEKNIKMTVFLIGKNMEWKVYDNVFNAYRASPLIEICNHSYTHANNKYNKFYSNPNGVLMDFYKNIVKLNLTNAIARFPGCPAWALNGKERNVQKSRKAATELLRNKGFHIFGWDTEWRFSYRNGAPVGSAESVMKDIEQVTNGKQTFMKNHCVLLLHERMFQQKWEIARLLTMLQQKGYIFEHLKNYPKK